MRNWQGLRVTVVLTGMLCLCQFSYSSGSNFKATTSTPTYTTVTVNTEVYDATGWNGSLTVPTKDAIRDKIESLNIVSPFTTTSNVIAPTTLTDNLAVGTASNLAKLAVSGDTDEIQLLVRANSTQTSKIMNLQNSAGTALLTVSLDGTIVSSGIGNESMTLGSGAQSTYVMTGNVSGTDTTLTFGSGIDTFSGGVTASYIQLPNGTAPTVDAVGKVAVDTTDDQLQYYGAAKRVIPYTRTVCGVIENLASADDSYAFFMANDPITVTGVGCNCRGSCGVLGTLTLEDRGGNGMTITGTNPTCATTGVATFAAVTANNTLTAGEEVAFDVTNNLTGGDTYTICIDYTTDAQ